MVSAGAMVLPPLERAIGGFCAIIGFFGVMQGRTWAPTVAALGAVGWLVGQWSFALRHGGRYRSHLALVVFDRTPLRYGRSRATTHSAVSSARWSTADTREGPRP